MLDKELFKKQMERLAALYDRWQVEIENPDVMKIWYGEFKDYEDDFFVDMVDEYVLENQYNPTVAGIKQGRKPKEDMSKYEFTEKDIRRF